MSKSRIILVLGVLIALLPVLGFPRSWESSFQVLAGLAIVLVSVWTTIDKKISLKAKAQMRQARRKITSDDDILVVPDVPKRITDFYPKTGQPGRRVSDLAPTLETDSPNLNSENLSN